MKKLLKSKRGNWQDILEYSKGALILALSILISYILISSFNNLFISNATTNPILNDSIALDNMQRAVYNYPAGTDYILPILYIFFVGFSAWSASKIQSSHKFLFIGLIVLLLVVLFSMFIETMWQEFTSHASITSYISTFPITNFMLSYLRYFVLLYGLIVGVSLYSKNE